MTLTSDAHEHDNYWRLHEQPGLGDDFTRAELQRQLNETCGADHTYGTRVYKSAILDQISRIRRGQLCYHHLSEQTLLHFLDARHLECGKTAVPAQFNLTSDKQKARLIRTLQNADDRPTFHFFLQLTPELRNAVYELYLAPLVEHPVHSPTWPPLARVNRQLRDEVMTLFLHEAVFSVQFNEGIMRYAYAGGYASCLIARGQTCLFFSGKSANWISRIRRFRICTRSALHHNRDPIHYQQTLTSLPPSHPLAQQPPHAPPRMRLIPVQEPFIIDVDLDQGGTVARVEYQGHDSTVQVASRSTKFLLSLEQAVRRVFEGLQKVENGGLARFGMTELSKLRVEIEAVLDRD
ncbi:hypothetical protein EJ03DRAFT_79388 [Teratosphaeria nubilosa]|uniref:Uncharacterized protein n=1 Tax=Teratosphaeria nubilosa TaxID=161662 RepID=A0A6G1LBR0_9PEZI|nr:hypothetical protein EJ03DRAFT_79388 [Teratosphaeria nubilosa]